MIGNTLAHYEITAAIGKGGMGEVYQATDKKLGCNVAIKVLPEEFASDTERIARFEREAKLLASLNHPNIAAIYGLEQSEGTRFLVLELVEGQTLAERLVRGPLPVQESLELALQIAEALEAAHEKGVIHRDLKPANIKVTSEGKIKVLDFGLAKAYAGTALGDETVLETLAEDAESGRGVLLGTPAYMSPEQARRQPADHRSDVWAFGCVLYELLTGRTLFKGNTLSDTIAAVLEREPDFATLPGSLHPVLRRLLGRCLDKIPKRRWHAIADVRLEIEGILADPEGVGHPTIDTHPPAWRSLRSAVAVVVLGMIAGGSGWYLRAVLRPELRPVTRFVRELPPNESVLPALVPELAISRDGSRIVYAAGEQLHLWNLALDDVRPISTGDRPFGPFFSPDGEWIAYFSNSEGQLRKIAVDGGGPVVLSDVGFREAPSSPAGASWTERDAIVYGQFNRGIMRVPAQGGTPDSLVASERAGLFSGRLVGFPQILPGGRSLLFTVFCGTGGPTSRRSVP